MREILFRGKRADNGKWVEGFYQPVNNKKSKGFIGWYETETQVIPTIRAVIPETVGQYTGLKDKNGRKIFEGDICCDEESHFTVVWSESECGFKFKWEDEYFDVDQVYGEIEIIGNIYDGVSED